MVGESTWVWQDGVLIDFRAGPASLSDYSVDGHVLVETMRARKGVVAHLSRHVARLLGSAHALDVPVLKCCNAVQIARAVKTLCARSSLVDARVRLTASEVGGARIIVTPCPATPPSWRQLGARLALAPCRRPAGVVLAQHKLEANRTPWADLEPRTDEQVDALVVTPEGQVLEGCMTNVFAVMGGELVTPPVSDGLLPGVTRARVLVAACELGVASSERRLALADLAAASEVFVTNAVVGVVAVHAIDSVWSGTLGPVTQRIRSAYETACLGQGS